jgi:hypothetical protein
MRRVGEAWMEAWRVVVVVGALMHERAPAAKPQTTVCECVVMRDASSVAFGRRRDGS